MSGKSAVTPTTSVTPAEGSPSISDKGEARRKNRRDLLKQYYASGAVKVDEKDPMDINGSSFDAKKYVTETLRTKKLPALVELDKSLVSEIQTLDSDIQTLVYENYNKFISATDTVRQMKSKVESMEAEMERLDGNMTEIMKLSESVSSSLAGNREKISQLSGVHVLLKKLQFLFELPGRLKKCIEMSAYRQAVNYYRKATGILGQYEHIPSFSGIRNECQESIMQLTTLLKARFYDEKMTISKLSEAAELLLSLREPPCDLAEKYLQSVNEPVSKLLRDVEQQASNSDIAVEVFISLCDNTYVAEIKNVLIDFKKIFLTAGKGTPEISEENRKEIQEMLLAVVDALNERLFTALGKKLSEQISKEMDDEVLLSGLSACFELLLGISDCYIGDGLGRKINSFVVVFLNKHIDYHLQDVIQTLNEKINEVRGSIQDQLVGSLVETGSKLSMSMKQLVLAKVEKLSKFVDEKYKIMETQKFQSQFYVHHVMENFILQYFLLTCEKCKELSNVSVDSAPPKPWSLILVLIGHLLKMEATDVGAILHETATNIIPIEVNYIEHQKTYMEMAKVTAQELANHYVRLQGLSLSNMIRKSVETRDWLTTGEPRMVRSVMKRVVEDMTGIAAEINMFFEKDISQSSRSSEGNRYRGTPRSSTNSRFTRALDYNIMADIQKLFADRVEIFGSVEFTKDSMETRIVLIALKAYIECVRLRTFGKFGYQQTQVDVEYLRRQLWNFVKDEQILNGFLEEVINSASGRCLDPVQMDQSIIEVLLDK